MPGLSTGVRLLSIRTRLHGSHDDKREARIDHFFRTSGDRVLGHMGPTDNPFTD